MGAGAQPVQLYELRIRIRAAVGISRSGRAAATGRRTLCSAGPRQVYLYILRLVPAVTGRSTGRVSVVRESFEPVKSSSNLVCSGADRPEEVNGKSRG